jgi:hypothetical protein
VSDPGYYISIVVPWDERERIHGDPVPHRPRGLRTALPRTDLSPQFGRRTR